MKFNSSTIILSFLLFSFALLLNNCSEGAATQEAKSEVVKNKVAKYPSDVIPFFDEWKILLGNGTSKDEIVKFEHKDFFYAHNDGKTDWVVYKTPNSGVTSKNSSNTRSELHQKQDWVASTGGKLNGTCKVMHVSTTGDARVGASYSVVVGQIHSGAGHENEPFKLFYKKFPGHEKGSLFWNYEINTEGKNSGRWDFSSAIWGHDMSVVGASPDEYPAEPANGVALGEEFSYEVNVNKGMMYLTFTKEGSQPVRFAKNLIVSDYAKAEDMPAQTKKLFAPIGQDGVERPSAYKGELIYFKQGAYNQTNGKDPKSNMVWCTGAEVYGGNIPKQYANGSYAEVWFKDGKLGPGTAPGK